MIVNNLSFQRSDVQLLNIITNELNDEMLHVLCDYPAFSSHINNNNLFNDSLSRSTWVSWYQKKHSLTHPVFVAIIEHL